MKMLKSYFLAGASVLIVASGASAADLGVKKPSPVEYVKVCNTFGAGFFYIPGGNTCIKVGGRFRGEYGYSEFKHQGYGAAGTTGFRAQGHIQLDARTATEYGTLRTFVRLILNSRTGQSLSGSQERYGTSTVATGADFRGNSQTNVDFVAFIQFAGFTAGRTDSFFDYYTGDFNWIGTGVNGINTVSGETNLFAYTATFGSGFSATLSIEDPVLRRQLILPGVDNRTGVDLPAPPRGSFYGGSQTPDIVGNVRVEQDWGTAQLSAALHEVVVSRFGTALPAANTVSRDYGFAVQGGTTIKLPWIGADDTFVIQANYGQGTAGYTIGGGFNGTGSAGSGVFDNYNNTVLVDGYGYIGADGRARVSLSESYGLFAGIQHYWTPTIRQSLFGSWGQINYERAAVANLGAIRGVTEYTQWQVGSQVVWTPVKDLDLGVEVQYNRNENNDRAANYGGAFPIGIRKDSDQIQALFRVQRDF